MQGAATMEQKMLTAGDILSARDFVERVVEVPEWGGAVKVRSLTLAARYAISEMSTVGEGKSRKIDQARFAVGSLLYGLAEPRLKPEEADQMVDKSPEVVERIVSAVWEVSGLSDGAAKNGLPRA